MPTILRIVPNLENFFGGVAPRFVPTTGEVVIGGLEGGMQGGNPSVGIIVETADGVVFAETSLKLFLDAANVLRSKYGDPREKPQGPAA